MTQLRLARGVLRLFCRLYSPAQCITPPRLYRQQVVNSSAAAVCSSAQLRAPGGVSKTDMVPDPQQQQQQPGEGDAAATSSGVSQRDLPFRPGFLNKRDQRVPCAAQHVELLRCYKDASALSYGPCKPEYTAFWECMEQHRPPHEAGSGEGAVLAYIRSEGWPWMKLQAQRLKDFVLGGSSSDGA